MTGSPLKGCLRKFTPELRSERVYILVGCAGFSTVIKKMDKVFLLSCLSGSFRFRKNNLGGTTDIRPSLFRGGFYFFIQQEVIMEQRLRQLAAEAVVALKDASTPDQLNAVRVKYLGKKGEVTQVLRGMGALSAEERPRVGQIANEVRGEIEAALEAKNNQVKEAQKSKQLEAENIDVTLPGQIFNLGKMHPLTQVMAEMENIFLGLGFSIAEGPEVEMDYYNFEALNLPKDHPARDMQDTFFINPEVLLRTHTSSVQVRTMEKTVPQVPVKIICPGRVYRRDDDATHSPMFHQVEGLVIDKRITFADLKGVLATFAQQMFGPETRTRLRPSYFPFTEPSAEVDISCVMCKGSGCRVCKGSGWLEILGSGMVHPRVLEMSGYNPEEVTGFAFGMGVERIAMLKYGIDDLRLLFDNDLRFLSQF